MTCESDLRIALLIPIALSFQREEPRFAGPDPYDGVKLAVLGHIHDVIEVIGIHCQFFV